MTTPSEPMMVASSEQNTSVRMKILLELEQA
jgi:hypothetical protein